MNILLICPETPYFITNKEYYIPSSLLYLAAVLRKNGNDVNILDLNTFKVDNIENQIDDKNHKNHIKLLEKYENIIINRISNFQPSFIGITCPFSGNFASVYNYSKKIKEKFLDIPITIGGIHPTLFPYEILFNCSSIDYIIIGEGEETIVNLVNTINDQKFDKNYKMIILGKIDGLAYRYNGKIIVNKKGSYLSDLDSLPFPAYDLINLRDYYHNTSNWHNPKKLPINCSIPIISSRSCPNRCSFCSMFKVMGPRLRKRSPKNVVDEIEFLYNRYNHRHFSFMDDNLTLDKSHIIDICDNIIKRNLDIQFETPNGLSIASLDRDVIDILVSAGLVRISLAIESGSDFIRNEIMGKKLSRKKIFEIIRATKKYKSLFVKTFFIIGMPEETRETLWETYNMIKEIDVDKVLVSNILPFPGTRLYEQCIKDDLFINKVDPNNLWKSDKLYLQDNKKFFIKPYNLDIEELFKFREIFDKLIINLADKKIEEKNIANR